MRKYFEGYSGGVEDVEETFSLFSDVMTSAVIPEIPLPELGRIRNLFEGTPVSFLENTRFALFESEDPAGINVIESSFRNVRDALQNLAKERGIALVMGRNGAEDAEKSNAQNDPLEYRVLNVLYMCVEKLAALLTYKRTQIELSRKKLT